MSEEPPFEKPSGSHGDHSPHDRAATVAEVSARSIEMLNQTRPWVRLMGFLLWFCTVLMGLAGVSALALANRDPKSAIPGVICLVIVLIYGFLAMSLTGYASSIKDLIASESVRDLESALESQMNFWRAVGIITAVFFIVYAVIQVLVATGVTFDPNIIGR